MAYSAVILNRQPSCAAFTATKLGIQGHIMDKSPDELHAQYIRRAERNATIQNIGCGLVSLGIFASIFIPILHYCMSWWLLL